MAHRKMLILRGNSAPAGSYPDEQGKNIAWTIGALHVGAASEFARRSGYIAVVLDKPGQPETLQRIEFVVVLGAPLQPKIGYESPIYNAVARRKIHPARWKPAKWDLVYKTNPPKSALPEGLPKNTGTHMFGP